MVLLASLWIGGYFYAYLPAASALLLAAAPLPVLLISVSEKVNPWRNLPLRAGIVLIPVAYLHPLALRARPFPLEY